MNSATSLDLKQLIALQHQVSALAVRRKYIRAAMSGGHVSKLRGRGMEFDEVRMYQPGDDVGSIDWKVTARKGTTHVKMYCEERERPVLICLDYRRPMFFATKGALKSVVATKIAALLAWHGIQHGDRLGGLIFSDDEHFELKPSRGRRGVLSFLHHCTSSQVWQPQFAKPSLVLPFDKLTRRLRRVAKPGSLIYILSDFRGLNEAAVADLSQLARHNDVVLISVLDDVEKQFPDSGLYPVFDGKNYFNVLASKTFQQRLGEQYMRQKTQLEHLQKQHGLFHFSVATHDDVDHVVREQLWA